MDKVLNNASSFGGILQNNGIAFAISVALALLIIVFTSFIVQKTLFNGKRRNFIIVGPQQSGKTALYYFLTTGKVPDLTVSSIEPSEGKIKLHDDGYSENFTDVVIRDFPANSKLKNLYLYPFLKDNIRNIKGIIYVVDSSIFDDKYCYEIATDLLELLKITESIPNGVDLSIFCNKCDYFTSRKPLKIKQMLEEEISKLYKLKLNNLSKVTKNDTREDEYDEDEEDDDIEDALNPAFNGGKFKFEMLEGNVDFLQGNVFKKKTSDLTNWLCEKAAN